MEPGENDKAGEVTILLRVGELALKTGFPRIEFEKRLFSNINNFLHNRKIGGKAEKDGKGRIVAKVPLERKQLACITLSKIFGITSISPAEGFEFSDIEDLAKNASERVQSIGKTFGVRARRAGKGQGFGSNDAAALLGEKLLSKFPESRVDLENPESEIFLDIREGSAYVFFERISGAGGLPYGVEGKVLVIIDGNIESALAGIEAAKRGCALEFLKVGGSSEECAKSVGFIIEYLPQRKIDILSEGEPEEIAKKLSCSAIVTGKFGGAIPEKRGFSILEISPLGFLNKEEIDFLREKYSPDGGKGARENFASWDERETPKGRVIRVWAGEEKK